MTRSTFHVDGAAITLLAAQQGAVSEGCDGASAELTISTAASFHAFRGGVRPGGPDLLNLAAAAVDEATHLIGWGKDGRRDIAVQAEVEEDKLRVVISHPLGAVTGLGCTLYLYREGELIGQVSVPADFTYSSDAAAVEVGTKPTDTTRMDLLILSSALSLLK